MFDKISYVLYFYRVSGLTPARVDSNYAFMADSETRFPSPDDLLPAITAQPPINAPLLLVDACPVEDLGSVILNLYGLNQLIVNESETRDIWADGVFAWNYIVPVLYKLLQTRYEHPVPSVLRAGSLLYIAAIRRRFGVRFLTHVQIRNLKNSMTVLLQEIGPIGYDPAILMWLLVLGSTLSFLKEDHEWFVSQTAQHIFNIGCGSWDEVIVSYVQKVMWINDMLCPERAELRQELSRTMQDSYRRDFS
jgi:hypothetical protein